MLAQLIVPAAAAILGVFVGGLITFYAQRRERRHEHARRQLECFYGPLLAMKRQIRSKIEVQESFHRTAKTELHKTLDEAGNDLRTREIVEKARAPKFEGVWAYSDEQLTGEIVPLYGKMLEHFTQHMWLAEPSSLNHFQALVEFVETLRRVEAKNLPHEVIDARQPGEKDLLPLYEDLESQAKRLRKELRK